MGKNKKFTVQLQVLIIIILILLLVRPMILKVIASYKVQGQLLGQVNKLESKLSALAGIDAVLINDRVVKMEAVFPSEKPVVALMSNLAQLAEEHNLKFGGISLSPGSLQQEDKDKSGNSGLHDLKFGFQISGDFDRISKFMQNLENTAPLMKIEEVGLSIKTNPLFERSVTMVVADIKVAAYYQSPPESIGTIDRPIKLLSRSEESLLNKLVNFRTYPQVVPLTQSGKVNLFE